MNHKLPSFLSSFLSAILFGDIVCFCGDSSLSVIMLTQCTTWSSPSLPSVAVSYRQGQKQLHLQVLIPTPDIRSKAPG